MSVPMTLQEYDVVEYSPRVWICVERLSLDPVYHNNNVDIARRTAIARVKGS